MLNSALHSHIGSLWSAWVKVHRYNEGEVEGDRAERAGKKEKEIKVKEMMLRNDLNKLKPFHLISQPRGT